MSLLKPALLQSLAEAAQCAAITIKLSVKLEVWQTEEIIHPLFVQVANSGLYIWRPRNGRELFRAGWQNIGTPLFFFFPHARTHRRCRRLSHWTARRPPPPRPQDPSHPAPMRTPDRHLTRRFARALKGSEGGGFRSHISLPFSQCQEGKTDATEEPQSAAKSRPYSMDSTDIAGSDCFGRETEFAGGWDGKHMVFSMPQYFSLPKGTLMSTLILSSPKLGHTETSEHQWYFCVRIRLLPTAEQRSCLKESPSSTSQSSSNSVATATAARSRGKKEKRFMAN